MTQTIYTVITQNIQLFALRLPRVHSRVHQKTESSIQWVTMLCFSFEIDFTDNKIALGNYKRTAHTRKSNNNNNAITWHFHLYVVWFLFLPGCESLCGNAIYAETTKRNVCALLLLLCWSLVLHTNLSCYRVANNLLTSGATSRDFPKKA